MTEFRKTIQPYVARKKKKSIPETKRLSCRTSYKSQKPSDMTGSIQTSNHMRQSLWNYGLPSPNSGRAPLRLRQIKTRLHCRPIRYDANKPICGRRSTLRNLYAEYDRRQETHMRNTIDVSKSICGTRSQKDHPAICGKEKEEKYPGNIRKSICGPRSTFWS